MGQDVDLVIVDGEIMMEGRTLTQIDEAELCRHSAEVFAKTMERAGNPEVYDNPKLYEIRQ